MSFAKAAFDEVAADVKMDDEAFWDKILPEVRALSRFEYARCVFVPFASQQPEC